MSSWYDFALGIPEYLEEIEEIKAFAESLQMEFYNFNADAELMTDSALLNNLIIDSDRWMAILGLGRWDVLSLGAEGIKALFNQEKRVTRESLRAAAARESGDEDAEAALDLDSLTVTIRADMRPGYTGLEEKMREFVPCNLLVRVEKRTVE